MEIGAVLGSRSILKSTSLTRGKLGKSSGKTSTNSLTMCTDEIIYSLLLSRVKLVKNALAPLQISSYPLVRL